MRKFFFSLFFVCAAFAVALARKDTVHLTFEGIPIDGTLKKYVSKMKRAGFACIETRDGVAVFRGDFAGFENCTIAVATLESTDKVNAVGVVLPERKDWASLENDYRRMKTMLAGQYGDPSDCAETFRGGTPESDSSRLSKLKGDECMWYATYRTPEGDVRLSVGHQMFTGRYVVQLCYSDRINTDAAQAVEDL